jgi:hypothetical protein
MKTRVEIPDDLYHRAKIEAASRGRTLATLVEEGLRLVLRKSSSKRRKARLAVLIKGARGMIDSGIPDIASNPEHLAGFGRNNRRVK